MNNAPAYAQGVKTALGDLRLEKSASPGLFSKLLAPSAKYLGNLGSIAEKNIYAQTGKFLSPASQRTFKAYTKGIPGQTLKETALGAGLGAAIGAPLEAAFAEPGERGEAALHGAVSGLGTGALWGGISGLSRGLIHNATRRNLQNYASSRGFKNPAAEAKQLFDERSWWQNVKDTATGKGPLGRRGAATAALGGTAGLVLGDVYLPTKIDSMINPLPAEYPAQPLDQPRVVTASAKKNKEVKMPAGIKGSILGSLSTNIGVRALLHTKKFPLQKKLHPFALEIAPILLTTAGSSGGYLLGKKLEKHLDSRKK